MKQKSNLNWKGKKVLVTGAGGFIGSHLVEALVNKGADVKALVKYNSGGHLGWLGTIPGVNKTANIVAGDLRDADTVMNVTEGCDYVFHLGAIISIPYSYVNPSEVVSVNVVGTLNVLNACRRHKVKRLMHTSTSEVYGSAQFVPITEKHPLQGQSPYSASKIGADKLVESYYNTYDLPATTIRPFNTYGPRQSARAVIPTIIVQLLTRSKVKLGALNTIRDFTYVADTVEGMIKAVETKGIEGRTINLGSNSEITIGELVQQIAQILKLDPSIVMEKQRIRPAKSEVVRLRSDNALALQLMGWAPKVTAKQGLLRTIDWLKVNLEHYKRAQDEYIF